MPESKFVQDIDFNNNRAINIEELMNLDGATVNLDASPNLVTFEAPGAVAGVYTDGEIWGATPNATPNMTTLGFSDHKYFVNPYNFPLRGWFAALESIRDTPARLTVIGDSISEYEPFYLQYLGQKIEDRYPSGYNYLNQRFRHVDANVLSNDWDVIDGIRDDTHAIGGYSYELDAATSDTVETTVDCDSIDIFYTAQKAGGCDIEISIDDVLVATVSTLDAGMSEDYDSGRSWSSGDFGIYAAHKVTVEAVGSGTAIIDGGYFHAGTRDRGVQIINGAHNGWSFDKFNNDNTGTLQHLANNPSDLILIHLGTNDHAGGFALFRANVDILLTNIRASDPLASIAIVIPHKVLTRSDWIRYAEELREAARKHNCAIIDTFDALGGFGNGDDVYDFSSDQVHPAQKGARLIASTIADIILPQRDSAVPAVTSDGLVYITGNTLDVRPKVPGVSASMAVYKDEDQKAAATPSVSFGHFFGEPFISLSSMVGAGDTVETTAIVKGGLFSIDPDEIGFYDNAVSSLHKLKHADATEADQSITLGQANTAYYPATPNLNEIYVEVAGDTMTGSLLFPDGTSSNPSIGFSDDVNTGFYSHRDEAITITATGSIVGFFTDSYVQYPSYSALVIGADDDASTTHLGIYNEGISILDGGTGLFPLELFVTLNRGLIDIYDTSIAAGHGHRLQTISGQKGDLSITGITVGVANGSGYLRLSDGGVRASNGNAATPSYQFVDDQDTGIFRSTPNYIEFSHGGTSSAGIRDDGRGYGVDPTASNDWVTLGYLNSNVTTTYAEDIGDGSTTEFTITHNMNTRDVVVQVRETASPYEIIDTEVHIDTVDAIGVNFQNPPTTNQYRVIIVGIDT